MQISKQLECEVAFIHRVGSGDAGSTFWTTVEM